MDEQHQRRRRDAASWHAVMRRFADSNATVAEFCAREGLSTSSFYRWRARSATAPGSPGLPQMNRPPSTPATPARSSSVGFIELGDLICSPTQPGPAPAPAGSAPAALELRLELGAGLVLQLSRR